MGLDDSLVHAINSSHSPIVGFVESSEKIAGYGDLIVIGIAGFLIQVEPCGFVLLPPHCRIQPSRKIAVN